MRACGVSLTAALMAVLLPGCSKFSGEKDPVQRISLPGFSIELPSGKSLATSKSPTSGKHQVDLPSPGFKEIVFDRARTKPIVWVEWSTQAYSRDEWKTLLMPAIAQSIGKATKNSTNVLKEQSVSRDRWLFITGSPSAPIAMGAVNCEETFSITIIEARYGDVEREAAAMRRMVESVNCEVTDENRARPVAATRLPAKFGRTPDAVVQTYQSLDGEQLIVNFTRSDVQKNHQGYRTIIQALLSNALGTEIPDSSMIELPKGDPHPAGRYSLMRLQLGSADDSLYVGTFYCPRIDLSLITLWYSPRSSDPLAHERLSQVGCPGEESTETPPFEQVADEACRAGQKQFCGLKEMPEE